LPKVPDSFTARTDAPLTLRDSEPEPDISVVRGADSDFIQAHPNTASLLIEIAVSSAELDRELAFLYAEAGVEEYWIVLADKRAVEVFRRPVEGVYQEKIGIEGSASLASAAVPGFTVSLKELFG